MSPTKPNLTVLRIETQIQIVNTITFQLIHQMAGGNPVWIHLDWISQETAYLFEMRCQSIDNFLVVLKVSDKRHTFSDVIRNLH